MELPDDEHYAILAEYISRCDRLVEALVSQAVSETKFATQDKVELESLVRRLSSFTEDQFIEYLKTRRGLLRNPEVSDSAVPLLPPAPAGLGVHDFYAAAQSWNDTFGEWKRLEPSSDGQPAGTPAI